MESVKIKAIETILPSIRKGIIYEAYKNNFHYKLKGEDGYLVDIPTHCFELITEQTPSITSSNVTTTFDIKPEHYKMEITPIEFIMKNNIPFIEGNVIKYICRYKQKNGKEDLLKAKQYIDFLLEQYESK